MTVVKCSLDYILIYQNWKNIIEEVTQQTESDSFYKTFWDPNKKPEFINNLNLNTITEIDSLLDTLYTNPDLDNDIMHVTNKINNLLITSHEKTFKKTLVNKVIIKKKPWYDPELNTAKKNYKNAREKNNVINKQRQASNYKSLLYKKKQNYIKELSNKLKKTKVQRP